MWLVELPGGLDGRVQAELSYARDHCRWLLSRIQPGTSSEPFEEVRAKILQDALARVEETMGVQSVLFGVDGMAVSQAALLGVGMLHTA